MPKRKRADHAPLTTATPLTYPPTLQAVLDAQPSDPSIPRHLPVLDDDVDFAQYLNIPDDPGLDVDVDDTLIDPALLDLFQEYESTSTSPLSDLPEESDKQLVNDYRAIESHARPYQCRFEDCDKAFARKSDLARHFRIHTNERHVPSLPARNPFTCHFRGCGKSFIQRSALTVHHRVHTGERPHTCEVCNKAFADSSSLARHRRIHTGSKPYACAVHDCEKAFARRNSYLKHHKREHPEEPEPTVSIPRAAPLPPPFTPYHHPLTRARKQWPSRSASAPHGFAASHPSEGAAYAGDGFGGYRFGGGGGEYDALRVGGRGGAADKPYRFPPSPGSPGDTSSSSRTKKGKATKHKRIVSIAAPASAAPKSLQAKSHQQQQQQQQPSLPFSAAANPREASPHPSLASDDSDDDSDDDERVDERDADRPEPLPGTPLLAVPLTATTTTFSDSGSAAGFTFGQPQHYAGPHSAPIRSDGVSPRQVLAHGQYGGHGPGVTPFHQVPRQTPSDVMYKDVMGRTVSSPAVMRSPDEQVPWVGGGFSASQLAIPPGHTGYFPPSSHTVGNTPLHTALPSPTEHQTERRLTDPNMPSFSFQAPGGTAVMIPVSAIQSTDFSMLNTPIQSVTVPSQHEHDLPQTAPPSLTRFNSAPSVPTRNGINVNDWLSSSTGPAASTDPNGRFPMLPSVSATLSAIADQSPLSSVPTDAPGTAPLPHSSTMSYSATLPHSTTMPYSATLPPSSTLPQSATVPYSASLPHSATVPQSATIPTYTPAAYSGSPATDSHGHWGAPIAFPAPPRSAGIMPPPLMFPAGPPTPALTSGATASTSYPQPHGLAPIHQSELYTPHTNDYTPPMPVNPHAGWTVAKQEHRSPMYKPYPHVPAHQAPYSAHPGLYSGQLSPFTPITAQSHMSAGYHMPYTPHPPQHFQYPQPALRNEQTIMLSTPPRGRSDRTASGMSGIGLGLANVSFGDRSTSLTGGMTSLMTGAPFRSATEHVAQPAARQPLHPMLPPQISHPPPPREKQHPPPITPGVMDANADMRYAMEHDDISSEDQDDEYHPAARAKRRSVKKSKKNLKGQGLAAVSRAKGRSV